MNRMIDSLTGVYHDLHSIMKTCKWKLTIWEEELMITSFPGLHIYIYVVNDGKLLCIRDFFSVFGHLFLHKLVHDLRYKWDAFLNIFTFEIFVQKYDSYRNCRKKWVLFFEFCTKESAASYLTLFRQKWTKQETTSGEEALRDHLRYSMFAGFNFFDHHSFS